MRFHGKSRLGFFALPLSEAHRIRRFLLFPDQPSSALDPCIGDGVAFDAITEGPEVLRFGIELDAYRAEQARNRIPNIVQGNTLEVQCPVECFGLLYLNPPYDWAPGPADSRRTEQAFLSHTYRWLKPGGVLVFVIPGERLAECSQILATHFRDVRVFRLEAPECVRYKQVVAFGVRRNRREKERLNDSDITRPRLYYASLARNPSQISILPSQPETRYNVPVSGPAQLVHRGLPLDEVEDLLPQSAAYRLLAGRQSGGQDRGRRGWRNHTERKGKILERVDSCLQHRPGSNPEVTLSLSPRFGFPHSKIPPATRGNHEECPRALRRAGIHEANERHHHANPASIGSVHCGGRK